VGTAQVGVQLEGFEEIGRFFARLDAFDKKKLADFVGAELADEAEQAFQDQKDPVTGTSWPELAASTLAKKGGGGTKLVRRGHLRRSIGAQGFPDGSVLVGNRMVYSRIHQEGGKTGRGGSVTMPQRRFLGYNEQFLTRIYEDGAVRKILGFEE
jgi:phage virion morphogenesis protein